MSDEIEKCYRALDLNPGAGIHQIKESYRDLVRVWHPDRFPNDSRVREKAQERLKEINLAYEKLQAHLSKAAFAGSAEQTEDDAKQASRETKEQPKKPSCMDEPPEPPPAPPVRKPRQWSRKLQWGIAVSALFALVIVVVLLLKPRPSNTNHSSSSDSVRNDVSHANGDEMEESNISYIDPNKALLSSRSLQSKDTADMVSSKSPLSSEGKTGHEASSSSRTGEKADKGSFTLGSTKKEVLSIQGTPDSWTKDQFVYGYSTVQFKEERVVGWSNSVPKLKVRLLPSTGTVVQEHFTIGSAKDEVLSAQGTPDVCTEDIFTYGYSTVLFKEGRVVGWSNSVPQLKVRLVPAEGSGASKDHFTVGSTRDEVLSVQGTPDSCTEDRFSYGYSIVHFKDGKVESWDSSVPPLKARLTAEEEE